MWSVSVPQEILKLGAGSFLSYQPNQNKIVLSEYGVRVPDSGRKTGLSTHRLWCESHWEII